MYTSSYLAGPAAVYCKDPATYVAGPAAVYCKAPATLLCCPVLSRAVHAQLRLISVLLLNIIGPLILGSKMYMWLTGIITISQKFDIICPCFEQMDVIFGSQPNITPPSVADKRKKSIGAITVVDEHIDDKLPNLGESPFDNVGYSQDNMFEEREEGIENIQHYSDINHHDLS
ncbi:hypothetical protein BY996DRAFT_6413839 [Phakopsora pachyrhizi]|nr:hypothetical protein BY996DRAFT_6413839 [Phakopsora pachyrhizi]